MTSSTQNGLDWLRQHVGSSEQRASIFATMGMHDVELEEGHVVIRGRADERHLNPLGGVHGGFAATILDSVTGCAVHSMLAPGETFATIDLAVKMLRPVPTNEDLVAESKVSHLSRSIGVAEATLVDASGRLLAIGSATCFIKRPSTSGK